MGLNLNFLKSWKEKLKISPELKYILILFLVTRVALWVIGIVSTAVFASTGYNATWPVPHGITTNMWNGWDSSWYKDIAQNGYSASINSQNQANYGFFPLYSLSIRPLGYLIGDYFIAGVIMSNLFLILACLYLYKIARLDYDEKTSLRTVKYLFIFPVAFILSTMMSDSLFLLLVLMSFYYAKKESWFLCGLTGMLFSLTRPQGVFLALPLGLEYLKSKDYKIKKIKFSSLYLLLIPLGLVLFMTYLYFLTGDFFAYQHTKAAGWGNSFVNPLNVVYNSIAHGNIVSFLNSLFAIFIVFILTLNYKKIGYVNWLMGILTIFISIGFAGPVSTWTGCVWRYSLAIFPIYFILADYSKEDVADQIISSFLLLLQGFYFVFWSNQIHIIS